MGARNRVNCILALATASTLSGCALMDGLDGGRGDDGDDDGVVIQPDARLPCLIDAYEPNNSQSAARSASGTINGLVVCSGDDDWFRIASGGTVQINFTHSSGDIDLSAHNASGVQTGSSLGLGNSESVSVAAGGAVRVYLVGGGSNSYTLSAP